MFETNCKDVRSCMVKNTKERLIDSAEHLFAQNGYHNTSLRAITTKAEANLAAVNYHFGSKEALITAVLERRLLPLNDLRRQRLAALREQVKKTGPPLPSGK
jgi:AcrR family transcriptional regulator